MSLVSPLQEIWRLAEEGEFNSLPASHEREHFITIRGIPAIARYEYSAERACRCWLKTGNRELGGR